MEGLGRQRRQIPKARIRRQQILVLAGAVAVSYMGNAAILVVNDEPLQTASGGSRPLLLRGQLILRTAFHALLTLGVTGLYCASRNRVWALTAAAYLVLTGTACAATALEAFFQGSVSLAAACFSAQFTLNAVFAASWVRLWLVAQPGDDDHESLLPPQNCLRSRLAFWTVATGLLAGSVACALLRAWESRHSAAEAVALPAWIESGAASIGQAGHEAVSIAMALFGVVKQLEPACWAFVLVGLGSCVAHAAQAAEQTARRDWSVSVYTSWALAFANLASVALVASVGLKLRQSRCTFPRGAGRPFGFELVPNDWDEEDSVEMDTKSGSSQSLGEFLKAQPSPLAAPGNDLTDPAGAGGDGECTEGQPAASAAPGAKPGRQPPAAGAVRADQQGAELQPASPADGRVCGCRTRECHDESRFERAATRGGHSADEPVLSKNGGEDGQQSAELQPAAPAGGRVCVCRTREHHDERCVDRGGYAADESALSKNGGEDGQPGSGDKGAAAECRSGSAGGPRAAARTHADPLRPASPADGRVCACRAREYHDERRFGRAAAEITLGCRTRECRDESRFERAATRGGDSASEHALSENGRRGADGRGAEEEDPAPVRSAAGRRSGSPGGEDALLRKIPPRFCAVPSVAGCEPPRLERLAPVGKLVLDALCTAHVLAWWFEALLIPARHEGGGLYSAGVAASVGGAHGAVLFSVQLLHNRRLAEVGKVRGFEALQRRAFHVVASTFYFAAACITLAAALCLLRREGAGLELACSSAVRACATLGIAGCVYFPWLYEAEADGSGGDGGCDSRDHSDHPAKLGRDDRRAAGAVAGRLRRLQRQATAAVSAVAALVSVLTVCLPFDAGEAGGRAPPVEAVYPHSPGGALAFHFSFLYALHALVGAHHFRRISLAFVLSGSPFICALIATVIGKEPGDTLPVVVLASLFVGIATSWVLLLRIWALCEKHPELFPSGNVGWQ